MRRKCECDTFVSLLCSISAINVVLFVVTELIRANFSVFHESYTMHLCFYFNFSQRLVKHGFDRVPPYENWPPHSPDLSVCPFFLLRILFKFLRVIAFSVKHNSENFYFQPFFYWPNWVSGVSF